MKPTKSKQAKRKPVTRVGSGTLVLPLPRNVADARIEALEEAAGHLDLTWTEDDEEKIQGHEVSHQLRAMAQQIFELRQNDQAHPQPGGGSGGAQKGQPK